MYNEAIEDNNKVIELDSKNFTAYNNRGYEKMKLGRYTDALADFNRCIDLNPNYENAYNNKGSIDLWQGDYNDAIKEYTKALAFSPKSARAYTNKGLAEFKMGNYNDALNDYNTAIDLDENNAYAYLNIGELKLSQRDYKGAIKAINKAISIDSTDARAYNSLGFAYFKSGNYKHAISNYSSGVAKGGISYKPYYQYSNEAIYALKQHTKADCNIVEWISPVEDVNKLYNGTIELSKPQVTVSVKVLSAQPINKQNIRFFINNQVVTDIGKINISTTADAQLNPATGVYEYEYKAVVQIPPGKSTIKVAYGKKHTPELITDYMTPVSQASLSIVN